MRYLSLFSGIEAATVAWEPLGWEAVGLSEIEPFPCALLNHYYPGTPNLGDVTAITESQIKALGRIDLVVFGSPCQDLSVAGKRKGLDGERSGLFRSAIQVIRWARKHCGCRFALWENVPGAFTSNKGADFNEVLRQLTGTQPAQPEKWRNAGIAFGKEGLVEWRTLDAQFFGVPQRRRRIFALADFGDWTGRAPILFESESLQRDSQTSRKAGEGIAGTLASRTGAGGFPGTDEACSGYVQPVAFDMTAFGQYGPGRTSSTLKQRDYKDATDLVVFNPKDDPVHDDRIAMPLQAQTNGASAAIAIHDKATRHNSRRGEKRDGAGNGLGITENGPMYTLTAGDKHAACFQQNQRDEVRYCNGDGQVCGAINAECGTKQQNYICNSEMVVRRLTPLECERLQGFPDQYTAIPYKNKTSDQCPDGPRYKALGNSMAVPVMRWIGRRIQQTIDSETRHSAGFFMPEERGRDDHHNSVSPETGTTETHRGDLC